VAALPPQKTCLINCKQSPHPTARCTSVAPVAPSRTLTPPPVGGRRVVLPPPWIYTHAAAGRLPLGIPASPQALAVLTSLGPSAQGEVYREWLELSKPNITGGDWAPAAGGPRRGAGRVHNQSCCRLLRFGREFP
jgi:hypothetical protein